MFFVDKKIKKLFASIVYCLVPLFIYFFVFGGINSHSVTAMSHTHTTNRVNDSDYCLVCDIASKINDLPEADDITIYNAAKVISQINAIDQLKTELTDEEYEELISVTDDWQSGEYGNCPNKYFDAKGMIENLSGNDNCEWLYVTETLNGLDDEDSDLIKNKITLVLKKVDNEAKPTEICLDMYRIKQLEDTSDFLGSNAFCDKIENSTWQAEFLLPIGEYKVEEISKDSFIVDGKKFCASGTEYVYDKLAYSDLQNITLNIQNNQNNELIMNENPIGFKKIDIVNSSPIYTGEELQPKVAICGYSDEILTLDGDFTVEYAKNQNVGTASVTIEGQGIYSGLSATITFDIGRADAKYTLPDNIPPLQAVYGKTLGEVKSSEELNSLLGLPKFDKDPSNRQEWVFIEDNWHWENPDQKLDKIGKISCTAAFTPTGTNITNFNWSNLLDPDGSIKVPIEILVVSDKSSWGETYDQIHYVDKNGITSREIDGSGIIWIKETSDGTSAWYGLDNTDGSFEVGSRFYVQWISPKSDNYQELYNKLDDDIKKIVQVNNGWIFRIGVEDPGGNRIQPKEPVKVYVQIGDDWSIDKLKAWYISEYKDEAVSVTNQKLDYPDGNDDFGVLTISHFLPYIIHEESILEEVSDIIHEESASEETPEDYENRENENITVPTGENAHEMLIYMLLFMILMSAGIIIQLNSSEYQSE